MWQVCHPPLFKLFLDLLLHPICCSLCLFTLLLFAVNCLCNFAALHFIINFSDITKFIGLYHIGWSPVACASNYSLTFYDAYDQVLSTEETDVPFYPIPTDEKTDNDYVVVRSYCFHAMPTLCSRWFATIWISLEQEQEMGRGLVHFYSTRWSG